MATTMPAVESEGPDFDLPDQDGARVRLKDLRGRWVVLYFYPKDDTPGCTKEACSFRDNWAALEAADAVVLGVSADSEASHRRFADKYQLPFRLLADADKVASRAYGAWGLKMNYGRSYEGMIRSTFVISPEGRIEKVWSKVKAEGHAEQVLKWLNLEEQRS